MMVKKEELKKKENKLGTWLFSLGTILIVFIAAILFNSYTEKCIKGTLEDGVCTFNLAEGEVCDGNQEGNVCKINAPGFFEEAKTWYWIIGLSAASGIGYLIYLIINKKVAFVETSEIKNYDPEPAKKAVERYFVKHYSMPHSVEEKLGKHIMRYDRNMFNWYMDHTIFQKPNKEWFFKGQVEVLHGTEDGIYTIICSLGRENLKEIEKGFFSFTSKSSLSFIRDELRYPLFQPRGEREILFQQLLQSGQEDLLVEAQQHALELDAVRLAQSRPTQQEQTPIPATQEPIILPYPHRTRKRRY